MRNTPRMLSRTWTEGFSTARRLALFFPQWLTFLTPSASSILTAAASEEVTATTCMWSLSPSPLKRIFSNKCTWNILSTAPRSGLRVRILSREGRGNAERGRIKRTKSTERRTKTGQGLMRRENALETKKEEILMTTREVQSKGEISLTSGIKIITNDEYQSNL